MDTAVIIQARLSSTRFPRKILADLCGKTVLSRVITRCEYSGLPVYIVIPDNEIELEHYILYTLNSKAWVGSPHDVLDRYYQLAKSMNLKHIIRVTADCPLVEPETISNIAQRCKRDGVDFGSNDIDRYWMCDGLDVEYMTFDLLEWLWKHAEGEDREHVTSLVYKLIQNKGSVDDFKYREIKWLSFRSPINMSKIKLSIDTPEDLERVKNVIEGKKRAVLE